MEQLHFPCWSPHMTLISLLKSPNDVGFGLRQANRRVFYAQTYASLILVRVQQPFDNL